MNQQLNVPDLSRNQATTNSQSPEDILHFKRRVIQARRKVEERRMIDLLKERLFQVFTNGKWKSCAPQYSLQLEGIQTSLISEMLVVKKRLVLSEVYALVFKYNLPYQLVYRAMYELMGEPKLQKQFEVCMRDSLTLMIYAMYELSRNQDMQIQPGGLLSTISNTDDFSGIEFLTKPESL